MAKTNLDDETTAALTLFNEYVAADRERAQREKRLQKAERAKDDAAALVKKLTKGGSSKELSEAEAAYRSAAEKWAAIRDGKEPPSDPQNESKPEPEPEPETEAMDEPEVESKPKTEAALERRIYGESGNRGAELEAVLTLAAEFPARHRADAPVPVFGRPPGQSSTTDPPEPEDSRT